MSVDRRPTVLPSLRRRALVAALLLASAPLPAALAQPAAEARRGYDLPAGDLARTLNGIARDAGLTLTVDGPLAAGRRAAPVRGQFTAPEAMRQALRGSGLALEPTAVGSFTLRPATDEAVLAPVQVKAGALEGITEGSGSYTAGYVSYGKGQAVRDIPQSLTVVTRQRIEDQALLRLEDVLRQTTGVTLANNSSGLNGAANAIYSRGFQISSMQVDGANIEQYGTYFAPNLAMYDSIQVMRGADGLFGGTGSPGGSVNLVRKRPTAEAQWQVAATVGSWNQYGAELDVAGPLSADGRLRGRAVLAHQDREFYFDYADRRNSLVYAIAEWEAAPGTQFTLGGSYERVRETPWRTGLPRAANGDDLGLSRSTALMAPWSRRDLDQYEVFFQLEQQLGGDWVANLQANYMKSDSEAQYGYLGGAIEPATGDGLQFNVSSPFWFSTKKTLDANVTGSFELFGRRHKLLVGADWQDIDWTEDLYNAALPPTFINIGALDPRAIPKPANWYIARSYPEYGAEQKGLYLRLNASLSARLTGVVGGRYSDYDYESPYYAFAPSGAVTAHSVSRYEESDIFTPYAGLVYELGEQWTAYASVTEIHQSQASRLGGPLPGSPLEAVEGRNYEVGVKSELNDGALTAAAAIYRIERTGEAVRDPAYPSTNIGTEGLNCCWLAQGDVVSEGVDLELSGELAPGWQLFAGYTYNDNENRRANAMYSSITPKHLFKLWSTYRLPARWEAWTLGAGVTAQSRSYVSGTAASWNPVSERYDGPGVPFDFTQGGYAVWNASVQYRIDSHWTLALNANNVFDRVYYKQLGSSRDGNWYGDPRNLMVTLRGRF